MIPRYDFYLASPFFTPAQKEREARVKARLRALGYSVFSPLESTFIPPNATEQDQQNAFDENIEAIHRSQAVFAITDGKDIGTIFEAGYAHAIGKPIYYYAETLSDRLFNLMLARSGATVIKSFSQLTLETIENPQPYRGEIE